MSTLYNYLGQSLTLEQFRKAKGIRQGVEQEPEVIEIKEEMVAIIEPEIKEEIKMPTKAKSKVKK